MGGGPRVPYPKHVWSPAGGWYCQPANWRSNTAVAFLMIASTCALAFQFSNTNEQRDWMPKNHRPFPSRLWNKPLQEGYAKQQKEQEASSS